MPSWRPDPGSVSCCQCHEHHVCVKTGKSACYVETGHSSACASWPCCQVRPRQPVLLLEQKNPAPVMPPCAGLEHSLIQPAPHHQCSAPVNRAEQSPASGKRCAPHAPHGMAGCFRAQAQPMCFRHTSLASFYQPTSPGRLLSVHVVESALPAAAAGPSPGHLLSTSPSQTGRTHRCPPRSWQGKGREGVVSQCRSRKHHEQSISSSLGESKAVLN